MVASSWNNPIRKQRPPTHGITPPGILVYDLDPPSIAGDRIAPALPDEPFTQQRLSVAEHDFYLHYLNQTHQLSPSVIDQLARRYPQSFEESEAQYRKRVSTIDKIIDTHNLTQADLDIVHFSAIFPLISLEAAAILTGVGVKRTTERLRRLVKRGLLVEWPAGYADRRVWAATHKAKVFCGQTIKRARVKNPVNNMLTHNLAVAFVAAHIVNGATFNILELAEPAQWPAYHRTDIHGVPRTGDQLIGEKEVRSSISATSDRQFQGNRFYDVMLACQGEYKQWVQDGKPSPPPEKGRYGARHHTWWIATPTGYRAHIPDLIVDRPRDQYGNPQSIHVEIEITLKSITEYQNILDNYRQNLRHTFDHVVWVCGDHYIERCINKARQAVGLDPEQCRTVRLRDQNGPISRSDLLTRRAYQQIA